MPYLRKSKAGFIVAGLFVGLALLALASHLYSVNTNTGDSGESAIMLIPFMLPWISWIPAEVFNASGAVWLAYLMFLLLVLLNGFLLYCLFGGLRMKRRP